tara:strand:+ start:553 stop:717 length:165 start_codon:yes stop_codon:yes gene_type:complete
MNYQGITGHYSHARKLARIYKAIGNELITVYEKNVTYATYMKNLKRIIKEEEEE